MPSVVGLYTLNEVLGFLARALILNLCRSNASGDSTIGNWILLSPGGGLSQYS